jgi:hypothetical protein
VRIWLDPAGMLAPGDQAHVYVQTSNDANLVVLLAGVDGHVTVLFPRSPAGDPHVEAGTYEIVGPGDSPAFHAGDLGRGVVLAAVSPDPVWFGEFVAGRGWNDMALTGAGAESDPEGALTDVVQRMLGDGSFNYDLTAFVVAPPPAVAYQPGGYDFPAPPVAEGVPYYDVVPYGVLATPFTYCRYFYSCPLGLQPVGPFLAPELVRDFRRNFPQGLPVPPQPALAVYMGGQSSTGLAPTRLVTRPRPQPVTPRSRVAYGARPRSRAVTAQAPAPAATPVPERLVTRPRSSAQVAMVTAARHRVLERRPRPVVTDAQPTAAPGLAEVPARGRVGVPLAAAGTVAMPVAGPMMVRAPLAGAPVHVRTTAGMTPVSRAFSAPAAAPAAQTFALPYVAPRLRVVR